MEDAAFSVVELSDRKLAVEMNWWFLYSWPCAGAKRLLFGKAGLHLPPRNRVTRHA